MTSRSRKRLLDFAAARLLAAGLFALLPKDRLLIGRNDFVHFYIGGLLYAVPTFIRRKRTGRSRGKLAGVVFKNSWFIRPAF